MCGTWRRPISVAATGSQAVLEWRQSSLSQAELKAVADVEIGTDRSYEAYIVDRPDQGVAIVWVDAGADEMARARRVGEVVVASLDWPA